MNSRTRILNALRRQPVDHVPLWLRFWPLGNEDRLPFNWRDPPKRAEYLLSLGIDDVLLLEPPLGYVEHYNPAQLASVKTRVQVIQPAGSDRYPLLAKEYQTPAGNLRQVIRMDPEWPLGEEIHLFDDLNIPRYVEPMVKTAADLPALRSLLADPTPSQMAEFKDSARRLWVAANTLEVAVEGGMTALGDSAMWLCGMEQVMIAQLHEPQLVEQILDILLEWELKRVDILAEAGVDFITHMAWYEGTDFWTPRCYRRLLKPRLKQLVERVHAHHLPFRYIITKGWKSIQNDLLELEIDCLSGIDPVQDQVDLHEVKSRLGSRLCLMGGVNSALSLTEWDDQDIRAAVEQALRILAPGGGFVLYPVASILSCQPWDKVLVLIDQWKSLQRGNRLIEPGRRVDAALSER
jgi:uroporphyrinogen-III decarboxylase